MRGSILRKLAGESAIYGLSTILARFINFLFVPIYTTMLSTGSYGIATEFLAYIAILQVILTLGLETGCFNFANKHNQPNIVFSNALVTVGSISLIFFLLVTIFSGDISGWMGYNGFGKIIIYIGSILAIDAFTSILFARLRYQNKAYKFALFKTIKILSETAFNFILFFGIPAYFKREPDSFLTNFISITPDFTYIIFAIFLSGLVSLIVFIPDIAALRFKFEKRLWREMMIYSIPLMIAGLPGIINDTVDRPLFRFFTPEGLEWNSELGIFQAGVKIATLMMLFIQMFRYAAEPFFFAREGKEKSKEDYAMVMEHFTAFSMLVFLGITLFIDIIALIIGKDFRAGMEIVPIMLMSYVILGMNFNVSMWYKLSGKTKYAIYITAAGLPITLAINIVFMPLYSYHAAAWGHLLSYLVMFILSIFIGKKHYPIPYNWGKISLFIFTGIALYLVSIPFSESNPLLKYSIHILLIIIFVITYIKVEKISLWKLKL
ncbi:MAG: oligosaccharide flippase family protein [Bacteroidales bacterium]|jgi:O-antigen/teichoic acid export membrane protein|nr:oligosaccharide flippase family protein [Bacteroidales bacterium]MDD4058446.1 oligosaccharide flippase family protein [Bacteroidales bacterium]